jgi:glucose-fructose oxidoreductase
MDRRLIMARWKIAGICFEHMHMGDNVRMVFEHKDAEIIGICDEDPARMQDAIEKFDVPSNRVFTNYRECLETCKPDLVLLCPSTANHGKWMTRVAEYKVPVLLEKPFAASLEEADQIAAAMQAAGVPYAINWPLRWYPSHATAQRLVEEGHIGQVREVHYYDGNRGPLHHLADKEETDPEFVRREKGQSWWYKREAGGGSLMDYLGYGATLGTWFLDGAIPEEVTCVTDDPEGLEVDEHSVTVARYAFGLCTFQTRWGTFSDPWTYQPQPKCGFVLKGTEGTISSYDFEETVRLQTAICPEGADVPVDELEPPFQNPVQYMIHCLAEGEAIEGPLDPAVCRKAQRIVDTAAQSAREKRTLSLVGQE